MPTTLILVRHAETVWNIEGRQQGHLDSSLTNLGEAQAMAVARLLAEMEVNAIYSSDLGRARQTARFIAGQTGHSVQFDQRLREQHLGIFSGLTKAEIQQRHPVEYARYRGEPSGYVIPGGESAAHRAGLAIRCLEELALAHRGGGIVVVSHAGVVGAFLRHVLEPSGLKARREKMSNTGLSIFARVKDRWRVEAVNDVRHLSAPELDREVVDPAPAVEPREPVDNSHPSPRPSPR